MPVSSGKAEKMQELAANSITLILASYCYDALHPYSFQGCCAGEQFTFLPVVVYDLRATDVTLRSLCVPLQQIHCPSAPHCFIGVVFLGLHFRSNTSKCFLF